MILPLYLIERVEIIKGPASFKAKRLRKKESQINCLYLILSFN